MTAKKTEGPKGKTYNVRAVRWDGGWELHIEGVGVTQCRNLRDAETMVRDYIRLDEGPKPAEAARVAISKHVDETIDRKVAEVKRLNRELVDMQDRVAKLSREVVTRMRTAKHMPGAEIAAVLDVSPQRVSQLSPTGTARRARNATKAPKGAPKPTGRTRKAG
ncbi:hypothetical protein [Tenggerimyces flavus]|uniref:Uncharacterized protein n=1 Tax=Tenggerimyces flavus TaxID=1708749 RepID=A0ABV7YMR6_9ACTN|nr:hypothetical protein [Tenggerimyces flavus]MBM7786445.1 putative transcriptional regulator [Tenggerimyces flavus]